jgi:hypothetical protein
MGAQIFTSHSKTRMKTYTYSKWRYMYVFDLFSSNCLLQHIIYEGVSVSVIIQNTNKLQTLLCSVHSIDLIPIQGFLMASPHRPLETRWLFVTVRLTGTFIYDDTLDEYYKLKTHEKMYLVCCFYSKKFITMWHNCINPIVFFIIYDTKTGRDNTVGITSRYRMNGPGIEFWWGRNFSHPYRLALGPPDLLYNG